MYTVSGPEYASRYTRADPVFIKSLNDVTFVPLQHGVFHDSRHCRALTSMIVGIAGGSGGATVVRIFKVSLVTMLMSRSDSESP